MERIIKKVIKNKSNGQLLISVPRDSEIHEGDYVELIKVPEMVCKTVEQIKAPEKVIQYGTNN